MKTETPNNLPALPISEWEDTYLALHLWTQIVGKIKLKLTPVSNQYWNSAFHLSSTGLTTGLIHHPEACFQMDFDFVQHKLLIKVDDGRIETVELKSRSVADFYDEVMEKLVKIGVEVKIWTQPVEMDYKVKFENDTQTRVYLPEYVERFKKILLETDKVIKVFSARFSGKASPVHFFWGSFDLVISFFSGRMAPKHPGSELLNATVMEEAYRQEETSIGFWPGAGLGEPAYYAYTWPEPENYANWPIKPKGAYYNTTIKEFILPYEVIRKSNNPKEDLMAFMISAFEAGFELGNWDKDHYKKEL